MSETIVTISGNDSPMADMQLDLIAIKPNQSNPIAVDLTEENLKGLGFGESGEIFEGIFINTVASHRISKSQSGSPIQPGDRIKCVYISFDHITLKEACDLLNFCTAFKSQIILEKPTLEAKVVAVRLIGTEEDDVADDDDNLSRPILKRIWNGRKAGAIKRRLRRFANVVTNRSRNWQLQ